MELVWRFEWRIMFTVPFIALEVDTSWSRLLEGYIGLARTYYVLCIAFGGLAFIPNAVAEKLPKIVQVLRNVLNNSVGRGKTYDERGARELGSSYGSALVRRLLSASVPKRWFSHLYHVAVCCNLLGLLLLLASASCLPEPTSVSRILSSVGHRHTLVALSLLQFHVTRRLLENYFVHAHSEGGRMQLVGYAFGLLYYVFLPANFVTPEVVRNASLDLLAGGSGACDLRNAFQRMGGFFIDPHPAKEISLLAIFFLGNLAQYQCHASLASLRRPGGRGKGKASGEKYKIPQGFWFTYCSSPHYTAEVVLYVALITLSDSWGISTFLLMTMVLMNLGLSATMTQRWYLDKFEDYPKRRWAMIPGIF